MSRALELVSPSCWEFRLWFAGGLLMRRSRIPCAIIGSLVIGAGAVQAAPRQRPCAEIRAACEQAGFVQGGAQTGGGLYVDCIVPILMDASNAPGHQAFARDRFAARRRLQSAEPKFRPAQSVASASGRFANPTPPIEPPQVAPLRRPNAPPSQADKPPALAISPPPAAAPLVVPRADEGHSGEK